MWFSNKMDISSEEALIASKFQALEPHCNERTRRLWAATEARALGHGGLGVVVAATGLAASTVRRGLRELDAAPDQVALPGAVRRAGGGRPPLRQTQPQLRAALEALIEPLTRGDPMSPLRWCCKSARALALALGGQGFRVSERSINNLLHEMGYSLQSNRKTDEGSSHPDRNAQFEHINATVEAAQAQGQPVISVDCKKKELVGNYKNGGSEWQPVGQPEEVKAYDFVDKEKGKAIPYGVYDVTDNSGWVSVGTDADTAAFAVKTIGKWWDNHGQERYPQATELLIVADGGGSNSVRGRLWKTELQGFCNRTGLCVRVCHLPPGTSKWNKIEHRMFAWMSLNWRGRPLISYEVIVSLIGGVKTFPANGRGLTIEAQLDTGKYPRGIKISDQQLALVRIKRHQFHGEWNYLIRPDTS